MFDKHIPVPGAAKSVELRIKDLQKMAIGESFAIAKDAASTVRADVNRIHTRSGNTKQFTVRQYKNAYRCWRVA
jgi:hypothetical protein